MTSAATTATWGDLVALADQEQRALLPVLTRLATDPALEAEVAAALNYPDWPLPLTLLPQRAPQLITATPELAAYATISAAATVTVLTTLDRWGWPTPGQAPAADAAWLLLQHADTDPEARRDLLRTLTSSWETIGADPRHLALLTDRDRALHGNEQRYGTFVIVRDDQPVFVYPVPGLDRVDDHRRRIGLPTLADDSPYAYCPITPYRQARSTPVNPWPTTADPVQPRSASRDSATPAGRTSHGVYLAATLRHRNQIRRIRARMPKPLQSTARWLDLDPLTRPSSQFDAGIVLNQLAAGLCLEDIARAELLIAFVLSRRSVGVTAEIGCALTHGKPVIIVGGSPQCSFDMLPSVTITDNIDDALTAARHALTDLSA